MFIVIKVYFPFQNRFENLLRDKETGDIINRVIGRMAPEALSMLWPEIKPSVEDQIKRVSFQLVFILYN